MSIRELASESSGKGKVLTAHAPTVFTARAVTVTQVTTRGGVSA